MRCQSDHINARMTLKKSAFVAADTNGRSKGSGKLEETAPMNRAGARHVDVLLGSSSCGRYAAIWLNVGAASVTEVRSWDKLRT